MILSEFSRVFGGLGKIAPTALTLLFALLSVVPIRMPNALTITPFLSLMAVYYWAIYRPDLLPPMVIFLIGFIQDGVSGAYLGLTSLLFLGVYSFALSQRRLFLGKPFILVWGGFLLALIGTTGVAWGVVSLLLWRPVPFLQPALQFGTTLLLFPLVVWVFVRTHRHLLPER